MPDKVYSNAAWYPIEIAGLKRELPVCKLNDEVSIAGFVIFGDVEMTVRCAEELLKRVPEHDILITAESKGIPLIHEMARQEGAQTYVVARKGPKLYMKDPFFVEVQSISTAKAQKLYLDETEADKLKDAGCSLWTTSSARGNPCMRWSSWCSAQAATLSAEPAFWPRETPSAERILSICRSCP